MYGLWLILLLAYSTNEAPTIVKEYQDSYYVEAADMLAGSTAFVANS